MKTSGADEKQVRAVPRLLWQVMQKNSLTTLRGSLKASTGPRMGVEVVVVGIKVAGGGAEGEWWVLGMVGEVPRREDEVAVEPNDTGSKREPSGPKSGLAGSKGDAADGNLRGGGADGVGMGSKAELR